MEAPITKFIHVQQPDSFWHQTPGTSFKSPDLIELNSDSERNMKPEPDPVNYSSSQEEAETEDDCGDALESAILGKDGVTTAYDAANNDEESCHLLQTEDDSENSDSEHMDNSSKSSESRSSSSAGATISEGEAVVPIQDEITKSGLDLHDYRAMTAEQDSYYTTQFFKLQPDLSGIITGKVAKIFFEKSKLDQIELREIWQVADVTQDGNLDLREFKTAMHLVVLRRHGLPLPPKGFSVTCKEHTNADTVDSSIGQDTSLFDGRGISRPSIKLRSQRNHILNKSDSCNIDNDDDLKRPKQEEWTTFDNEPVNFSSRCDTSGLVAPVPVRLTPEDSLFLSNNSTPSGNKVQHLQLKSIQRPKLSGQQPKASLGTIAPPPPPRRKTHVRSSSLDLNRLGINASSDSCSQPNNCIGREVSGRSFLSPAHGGAFSVYRKPNKLVLGTESRNSLGSYDRQELMQLRQEVVELKNDNVILAGITTQLLDQLSGLEAKRGELTTQIQQWLNLRSSNYVASSGKHS